MMPNAQRLLLMNNQELMTLVEVASLLRVTVRTVKKLSELRPIRVGRQFRYRTADVAAYVAGPK